MKFIFFSAQYLPTVGGIERYTHSLAKQLIATGHSVVVVTSFLEGLPYEEMDENGIKIYRLPVKWFMNKRFPVITPNFDFKRLKSKIIAEKSDFALIQTRFYINSIFASRLCKQNSIPSMVVEHGSTHLINGGFVGFLGNIYEHMAFKMVRHYTKNIYAVSKISGEWLSHFHCKTDKLLYNSVDPIELLRLSESADTSFIDRAIQCKSPKIVCFTGRFTPQKGIIPLAKAFSHVQEVYPDSYLFMAGSGELFNKVKELNINHLVLTGTLSYPQSLALLKRSDIFCMPTLSEGFSTSMLEAAALKSVIITTTTGGSPELVKNGDYGILLPTAEEIDIYSALVTALSDDVWCKKATENAYTSLQESFTWEKTAKQLVKIAEQIKSVF